MASIREVRYELAELLAKREVSDELSAIVESILAEARAGLDTRRSKPVRVFELMADRLQADARIMHQAIDEIDALRVEIRGLRKEILDAREKGRPPKAYWLEPLS
jgi:uncharacterized coiled-coil DUF342 family protein